MIGRLARALLARPMVYDLVQMLAGQAVVARRLRAAIARLRFHTMLDAGSAAGSFSRRARVDAVSLDLDVRALAAARRRRRSTRAVSGDASRLPFPADAFDVTLCVAVSHHLDDDTLRASIAEFARVTSGHLVFLDALRDDGRAFSRWMWRYDRGSHPRTREQLLAAISLAFVPAEVEEFSLYHRYILCVATPRSTRASPPGHTKPSAL